MNKIKGVIEYWNDCGCLEIYLTRRETEIWKV